MTALKWLDCLADKYRWVAHIFLWLGVASFAWLISDRDPPFDVVRVYPAEARAGEYVFIEADVQRDMTRLCSVDYSRRLYDSNGTRFPVESGSMDEDSIRELEQRSPGKLRIAVRLPEVMATGHAVLETNREYTCNKAHKWAPIKSRSVYPITVLP